MDWASEKKGFAFAFGAGVRWQLGSRPRVVAGSIRLADSGVLGVNPDDVPVRPCSQFSQHPIYAGYGWTCLWRMLLCC